MTVADLEQRMTNREYVHWSMFFAVRGAEQEVDRKLAESKRGR